MNRSTTSQPTNESVDPDLSEMARKGHGVPSQDPDPAAQMPLDPQEAAREAQSVLTAGGLVAGLATGAAIGVAVGGPVGVVVGASLGAVAGVQMRHAYFPTTAVISLHYVNNAGASAEMAAVGREGLVGISLFMGGDTTTSSAMVRTAGHGYQLEHSALMRAFKDEREVQRLLLRYTQALMTQISQTGVCNRHHSVEQQLSTWLLSSVDRSPPGELVITHELVAGMLGVRRESITQAALALRDAGYIRYRRGHITVLDHLGLETCACECYNVVKNELHRLLAETARQSNASQESQMRIAAC